MHPRQRILIRLQNTLPGVMFKKNGVLRKIQGSIRVLILPGIFFCIHKDRLY